MHKKCNSAVALDAFFNEVVWQEPIKYAMFGAGCSVATEPTAAISHFFNITQVCYELSLLVYECAGMCWPVVFHH